jgi:hypothetical protein
MLKQRRGFLDSEEGRAIRRTLQLMTSDSRYNTTSTYHPNAIRYEDNLIPFVDKHMDYLNAHPQLDAQMYIANIQLMTRVR